MPTNETLYNTYITELLSDLLPDEDIQLRISEYPFEQWLRNHGYYVTTN